jgi:hypothetical protein
LKPTDRLLQNEEFKKRWRGDREAAERRLAKKRERYAKDPAYAKAIKDGVKRRRAEKPKSDRKRAFNRDRVVVIGGQPVVLWSIGKSADYIGVSKKTLEGWERQTHVPRNKITDEIGRRWYPKSYVIFIADLFKTKNPKERLAEWASRVKGAWVVRQGGPDPIPVVCERTDGDGQGEDEGH